MKNLFSSTLALFFVWCLIAQPLYAAKRIRCWTNDDGVYECGNYVPQEYSQKGFSEYDELGRKIKDVEAAASPEELAELARQQEQERQRQEQSKKDHAFLNIFPNESDIEAARKGMLGAVDGQIQSLKTILENLKLNVTKMQKSYEQSKALNASKRQLKTIQEEMDRLKTRIKENEDVLQQAQRKRDDINREYDGYMQRHREIKRRMGGL